MDTILAVQKLFRLARDSPLSSNDVFGTKDPHPAVYPFVAEDSSQDVRVSTRRVSLIQSAHPTSQKQQASIPIPIFFLRKLSKHSSRQSNRMLKSGLNSKSKCEDVSPRQRERSVSVATGTAFTRYAGPTTVWAEPDPFLPRAPPPPPKRKHARNRTENNVPPLPTPTPAPAVPSPRPSMSYSSGLSSPRSYASRQSFDVPIVTISSVASYEPVPDLPHTLRRTASRTTVATDFSNESQTIFASSNCSWQPPAGWSGPTLSPTEEVEGKSKLLGWFSRKKSADGSKGGSMRTLGRLNRARSLKELKKSTPLDDDMKQAEGRVPVARGAPVPAGVAVKVQSGGDRWHEKPMTDIIPKLRNLRSK